MSIILVPQAIAKPSYDAALKVVYGINSCVICHTEQSGGKALTDYGSKFKSQPGYKRDSVIALRNIGPPPGVDPMATPIIPDVTTNSADTAVPAVTSDSVKIVITPVVVETVIMTPIPVDKKEKGNHELEENDEEEREKEETSEKSPGFDIIYAIIIVSTICVLRSGISKLKK